MLRGPGGLDAEAVAVVRAAGAVVRDRPLEPAGCGRAPEGSVRRRRDEDVGNPVDLDARRGDRRVEVSVDDLVTDQAPGLPRVSRLRQEEAAGHPKGCGQAPACRRSRRPGRRDGRPDQIRLGRGAVPRAVMEHGNEVEWEGETERADAQAQERRLALGADAFGEDLLPRRGRRRADPGEAQPRLDLPGGGIGVGRALYGRQRVMTGTSSLRVAKGTPSELKPRGAARTNWTRSISASRPP